MSLVDDVPALRLATALRELRLRIDAQPASWRTNDRCLVRIALTEALPDNARTSSALRGFLRRSGFGIAGATRRTLRLFYATLDQLGAAAAEFERRPSDGAGQRVLEHFGAIEPSGEVSARVGAAQAVLDLQVCYHVPPVGGDPWPGIEQMLHELGGTGVRRRTGVQNLGYGSVRIHRDAAATVAAHPLVRYVEPVPHIVLRRSS